MMSIFLTLAINFLIVSCEEVSYNGAKLLRITPRTEEEVHILKYSEGEGLFDYWTRPSEVNKTVDVLVLPDQIKSFEELNLNAEEINSDMGAHLEAEKSSRKKRDTDFFADFRDLSEIKAYVASLVNSNKNICSMINIGKTFEGRDMEVVKIGSKGNNKQAIFIDAGIHAREWVSIPTALYILTNLIQGYGKNADMTKLVDKFDWYILPVINPDGYEFSRKGDRFWRKNRSKSPRSNCLGVDLNRNFGFHFGGPGTSTDPCSEIFRGPNAFSEKESQNLRDFLLTLKGRFALYVSFHAYGHYILSPWGFTSDVPDNYDDLMAKAQIAHDAIKKSGGISYTMGSSTNVLYIAAGGSDDWSKGVAGATYSYTIEMRDDGKYGFALPARLIKPTITEGFEGIKAMTLAIADDL